MYRTVLENRVVIVLCFLLSIVCRRFNGGKRVFELRVELLSSGSGVDGTCWIALLFLLRDGGFVGVFCCMVCGLLSWKVLYSAALCVCVGVEHWMAFFFSWSVPTTRPLRKHAVFLSWFDSGVGDWRLEIGDGMLLLAVSYYWFGSFRSFFLMRFLFFLLLKMKMKRVWWLL